MEEESRSLGVSRGDIFKDATTTARPSLPPPHRHFPTKSPRGCVNARGRFAEPWERLSVPPVVGPATGFGHCCRRRQTGQEGGRQPQRMSLLNLAITNVSNAKRIFLRNPRKAEYFWEREGRAAGARVHGGSVRARQDEQRGQAGQQQQHAHVHPSIYVSTDFSLVADTESHPLEWAATLRPILIDVPGQLIKSAKTGHFS